jgi:RNA polymerase sigma-70 factor, ECF subfamily
MTEAADLETGVRAGDRAAIESAVRACLPSLMRTALAAGLSRERAEDAVQGTLVVLVRRATDYDGRARVCTWLHGILMNRIREEWRAVRREAEHDDIDVLVDRRFDAAGTWSRPPSGPEEALARGELREQLAECLEGLPERQRVAFGLRDVEGFTTEEVCKILDVSANNLGVLLFRARNRLRECLESKGFEGSADASL